MAETRGRSVAKAISWRTTGARDFLISWLVTGELALAGGIAGTEVLTKVALFYLHERAWTRVRWGRRPVPRAVPADRQCGAASTALTFAQAGEPAMPLKP